MAKKERFNCSTHGKSSSPDTNIVSRRRFISAVGLSSAAVLAGCSKSSTQPSALNAPKKAPINPPAGSPLSTSNKSLTTVATNDINSYDYSTLRSNLESAVSALGGLNDICPKGGTVGIKINLTGGQSNVEKAIKNFGLEPQDLYLTHPTVMQVVAELFKDAGAGRIIFVEAINDYETVDKYGYNDVIGYVGAELVDLNSTKPYSSFVEMTIPSPVSKFTKLTHNGVLYDLDCFVSLPKIKRHYGAGVTNAMKNMIGSTPKSSYNGGSGYRSDFHKSASGAKKYQGNKNLVRTIVDLNQIRPIHLAVCDGILTADSGEGPWNTGFMPVEYDVLVVSKDPVAADAISTQVMGFDPMAADKEGAFAASSLPGNFDGTDNYFRIAEELGMGVHDLAKINIVDATVNTRVEKRGCGTRKNGNMSWRGTLTLYDAAQVQAQRRPGKPRRPGGCT